MAELFCCDRILPYRGLRLDHEDKFQSFMIWAAFPRTAAISADTHDLSGNPRFVIQLVRQVNYGPLESKRYFVPNNGEFVEVSERDLIEANFQKLNSYKNWKCETHNKFFETNVYQKDPVNKHHWRANIARPAEDIDL